MIESKFKVFYKTWHKKSEVLSKKEEFEYSKKLEKIKEDIFGNFKKYYKETIENLRDNKITIHEAKDKKEAQEILKSITENDKKIVKSKSNVASEIGIEEALKDKDLTETDLGDFITHALKVPSVHPVLPALDTSTENITFHIKKVYGDDVKPTAQEIVPYLSQKIRKKINDAEVGITGANAITKDGQIVTIENEGNISLISRLPKKHIIITSIDKLTPTLEDALHVIKCATIWSTGKKSTRYINVISGPAQTADVENMLVSKAQGPKEVHLILLDNKRREILESPFSEILRCINCGTCLACCPSYYQLKEKFGANYLGIKGFILEYFQKGAEKAFESGTFKCTTCSLCKENCPTRIDLLKMIRLLREEINKKNLGTPSNKIMLENIEKHKNPFGKIDSEKIPDKLFCC